MERHHINLSLCVALLKSAGLWDQGLTWRDLFLPQGMLSPCGMSEVGMRLKRTSWANRIPKAVQAPSSHLGDLKGPFNQLGFNDSPCQSRGYGMKFLTGLEKNNQ